MDIWVRIEIEEKDQYWDQNQEYVLESGIEIEDRMEIKIEFEMGIEIKDGERNLDRIKGS